MQTVLEYRSKQAGIQVDESSLRKDRYDRGLLFYRLLSTLHHAATISFMPSGFFCRFKVDFRGRIFVESSFDYQASKLARQLLLLSSSDATLSIQGRLHLLRKLFLLVRPALKTRYVLSLHPRYMKRVWESLLDRVKSPSLTLITTASFLKLRKAGILELDVTASNLHFLALLSKDEELCFYTNVCKNPLNNEVAVDFYSKFADLVNSTSNPASHLQPLLERDFLKAFVHTLLTGMSPSSLTFGLYNNNKHSSIDYSEFQHHVRYLISLFKKTFPRAFAFIKLVRGYMEISIKKGVPFLVKNQHIQFDLTYNVVARSRSELNLPFENFTKVRVSYS